MVYGKHSSQGFSMDKYCFNFRSSIFIFHIHHYIFIIRYFGGKRHTESILVNHTAHVLTAQQLYAGYPEKVPRFYPVRNTNKCPTEKKKKLQMLEEIVHLCHLSVPRISWILIYL